MKYCCTFALDLVCFSSQWVELSNVSGEIYVCLGCCFAGITEMPTGFLPVNLVVLRHIWNYRNVVEYFDYWYEVQCVKPIFGGWGGGRKPASFVRNSALQTVPGGVACQYLYKGGFDGLIALHSNSIIRVTCRIELSGREWWRSLWCMMNKIHFCVITHCYLVQQHNEIMNQHLYFFCRNGHWL